MSTRMGQLKQLLDLGGRPAIVRVVEAFTAHLNQVIVVVGHRADEIVAALEGTGARCVLNSQYRQGMLSSVQRGVRTAGAASAYVIGLGDQPVFDAGVIPALLARYARGDRGIVLPVKDGRRGHPILLAGHYRQQILDLPLESGLNAITRGRPADTCELAVDDIGILEDMDTPEDYRRLRDRLKREAD